MRFELPEPPSANRWWRKWRGRMVLSTAARAYIQQVRLVGMLQKATPVPGDVRVDLIWHRRRRSGDLDKRVGILLDALQGVAYHKDAQVCEITARRSDLQTAPGMVFVTVQAARPG